MEDQSVLKAFNEAINATLKNMGLQPSEPRSDLMMTKEGHETSVLLDDSQMNLIS